MKRWHYHLGVFTAVAIFTMALPDGFKHDHPWRYWLILAALVLDNRIGYMWGQVSRPED